MPHKPVGIVAAMKSELAPLLRGLEPRYLDGVNLFELEQALVAVAGMGARAARHAAETVVVEAQPHLLVSAGLAGAVSPNLKAGEVLIASEVLDAESGKRYPARAGNRKLASVALIGGPREKQDLAARYGADAVDMEAAAVAEVAVRHGLEFAALKAISDEAHFVMPPLMEFVEDDGTFATRRFLASMMVRPKWWPAIATLHRNSKAGAAKLSSALEHLMSEYGVSYQEENGASRRSKS